jgi:hypothetical protein
MMKIKISSVCILLVFLLSAMQIPAMQTSIHDLNEVNNNTSSTAASETIYILIVDALFADLEDHLTVYAQDLNNEGYDVQVHQIPESYGSEGPAAIRSLLQEGYLNDNLVGCILVGNVPSLYIHGDGNFISDFYYMDLDGEWNDADDNGVYDDHTGNRDLEIWVGRFWTPNGGNDVDLLKNYFRKNHAYRSGNLVLPKRALYYETRWDQWHDPNIEQVYLNNLRTLYEDVTFVAPWEGDPSPSDYLSKLQLGYEFIYVHTWSTVTSHTFTNGDVYYYDIDTADPHAFFYLLSACNVANYMNSHYIAGSYIFSQSYGLTALAPTTTSFEHPVWIYYDFVESLNSGNCIGESFMNSYNDMIQAYSSICCLYSHTILGDPSFSITDVYGPPPENTPPSIPTIEGPTDGNIEETYSYTISCFDDDLDRFSLSIDWGDGTTHTTDALLQSGDKITVSHTWATAGTYEIKVKAIDEKDAESDWGTLKVSMPKSYDNSVRPLSEQMSLCHVVSTGTGNFKILTGAILHGFAGISAFSIDLESDGYTTISSLFNPEHRYTITGSQQMVIIGYAGYFTWEPKEENAILSVNGVALIATIT